MTSPDESALSEMLGRRLFLSDVQNICYRVSECQNVDVREKLLSLALHAPIPVSTNALWIINHLSDTEIGWLYGRQDILIDNLLKATHIGTRRMLLHLLYRLPFKKEEIRCDFVDYCLSHILSCTQPYAIRALCMKLAYEQCKYYPEMLDELSTILDMLSEEDLSPGLESAYRQVSKQIGHKRNQHRASMAS